MHRAVSLWRRGRPRYYIQRMRLSTRLRRTGAVAVISALAVALAGCSGDSSSGPAPGANADCPRVSPENAPRPGALTVGLNSVWNDNCDLSTIRAAGVTMERLELDWPFVEPARGRWRWAAVDRTFRLSASHGITVLPLLMGVPRWAGGSPNTLPADPRGFAGYVAEIVRRYGPRGRFWRDHPRLPYHPAVWYELWNEPYLVQFSANGPQPQAYARLVKASALAGRRVNPGVRFLLAADTTASTGRGGFVPWIGPMFQAVPDLGRYFDGVAVHPYSGPHSPLVYSGSGAATRFQFRRLEQVRQQLALRAGDKPFWITEVGWPTCPSSPENCVTEAQQQRYLTQMFRSVERAYAPWLKAVFLYNYRDSPLSSDPSDKERWFGLIRRNGTPKPAWRALQAATR